MGTLYLDSGGVATNSGSTDTNAATNSGSAATVVGSVVTLDGSPDLSGVVTSGATQSSIYLAQATNSNRKIFWITAFDDTIKTVTVSVAPTGVVSSAWAIGGRVTAAGAIDVINAVVAGDTIVVNNDLTLNGAFGSFRASGSFAAGPITFRGKAGTRPILSSNSGSTFLGIAQSDVYISHLVFSYTATTGSVINCNGAGIQITDCVFNGTTTTTSVNTALSNVISNTLIQDCEFSGFGKPISVSASAANVQIRSCYIHDTGGATGSNTGGIVATNATSVVVSDCILDRCAGRGILFLGTPSGSGLIACVVRNSTVYRSGKSGIEVASTLTRLNIENSILKDNGATGSDYNILLAGTSPGITGRNNCISIAGALGGGNVSGYSLAATDITTDPAFVDPNNGTASARNFGLGASSPCRATGYQSAWTGLASTVGYPDMGAVQAQAASSSVIVIDD